MSTAKLDSVEEQLKQIIHNLYSLMVQSYDYHGPQTANAMTIETKRLVQNLVTFTRSSRALDVSVPPEIIEYVENGRNPDIYTREFVEVAQRMNQQLKGKSEAFAQFRNTLAAEIAREIPELRDEVDGVLKQTQSSTG